MAIADLDRVSVGVSEAEKVSLRKRPVFGLEDDDALFVPLGKRLVHGFSGLDRKAEMVVA